MTHYDYKVVPAPRRAKRVKGVKGAEELFALTLTDAINEVARQGWEYVRAEHLPSEAPSGWFRGATAGEQTVLVFRRPRETLGPRLAAIHPDSVDYVADTPAPALAPVPPQERAVLDRLHQSARREPTLWRDEAGEGDEAPPPTPFRPRLGPAES